MASQSAARPKAHACAVRGLIAICLVLVPVSHARATWSIVVMDTHTKEIAVGSATCLTGFDLQFNLPMVIVDVGAACAQSMVDTGAINRIRIHDQLLLGTPPDEIIEILSGLDSRHQQRQYGIVDAIGRAATFTGSGAGPHASGVIGQAGSLVYAIQGNVLTGAPVVLEAQAALLNTPGDLPEKLMAAMQAARAMGGDGRCSCTVLNPPFCGAPPDSFTKSAHIAFMIVTRTGDTTGECTQQSGCANGDYYMDFNIAGQQAGDPDPVEQLQTAFDAWRDGLAGVPDAIQTTTAWDRPWVRAGDNDIATLTVTLRDWQGLPPAGDAVVNAVRHGNGSDQRTLILGVTNQGGGVFSIDFGLATVAGVDRFEVQATGQGRTIIALPLPELIVASFEDIDGDGEVDNADHAILAACVTAPGTPPGDACGDADIERDGDVDLRDFARFQNAFTNEACEELRIQQQPSRVDVCVGDPFELRVLLSANPDPAYQWKRDGIAIPGANGEMIRVDAASPADQGYYTVDIQNTCGVITSTSVPVRVITAPVGPCGD